MNKLRSAIVTVIVSSALSSSIALAGVSQNIFENSTHVKNVGSLALQSKFQKSLANRPTASGLKSQYDSKMGKTTFAWAANNQDTPDMSAVAQEDRNAFAAEFYLQSLTGVNLNKSAVNKAKLVSLYDNQRGGIVAKYTQEIEGIEVFNREYNIIMDQELNLIAGSGYFANTLSNTFNTLAFNKVEPAIEKAFSDMAQSSIALNLIEQKTVAGYQVFEATPVSSDKVVIGQPRAKKVLFEHKNQLKAAYYIEVNIADSGSLESEYYSYVIDAKSGDILFKNNLVASAENFDYRVYADSAGNPMEGPHGDVVPADGPDQVDKTEILDASMVSLSFHPSISTQDPWLADDATITSGNNAFAYADVIAPQDFSDGDIVAELTSTNTFDYPINPQERTNSIGNRKAAVVNLFFMNNYLHDFFYDHGFDEASGNAQNDNYGRGGLDDDALEVQAQDSSGLNNANMGTPSDGASPRMQMYLFNSKDARVGIDFGVTVISGAAPGVDLLASSKVSAFGATQFSIPVTEIIRIDDGTNTTTDGCEAAVNNTALNGKIVIIDRGSCAFTAKVLNAQNAGAIAAIIVNNVDDGTPAPMGGRDANVTIPNMGLNYTDGEEIHKALGIGATVTGSMKNDFVLKDGTFDNGIVAHEWGHYISNRLVGNANGLSNNQGRSMGEGWGDFHSLMFIAKASDISIAGNESFQIPYQGTTFVSGFYSGIRRVPYTPNMDINPLTFAHIEKDVELPNGLSSNNNTEVHNSGEVWATMLWDVYVSLINTHGFEEAQSRMADYLVSGYKMTPIAPTFTEARDGILASALANERADFELILAAFARRGMGLGAVSPDRNDGNHLGVKESALTELATFVAESDFNESLNGVSLGFCSNDQILDKGETGTVVVNITNKGSSTLTGVKAQLAVTTGQDVTFENDGLITFGNVEPFQTLESSPIKLTLNDANIADIMTIEVTFPEQELDDDIVEADTHLVTRLVNVDFQRNELVGTVDFDDMEDVSLFDNWRQNIMFGGDAANATQGIDAGSNIPFFEASGVDLGEQAMLLNNNRFQSDVAIETVPFTVGFSGNFNMEFWHFYAIEERWDGGVIEIRINDGEWRDVTDAGGNFDVGYVDTLRPQEAQVLGDRQTFTGRNITDGVFGNQEVVRFGNSLDGQQVQLRFRIATDSAAADSGWWIDNVRFTGVDSKIFSDIVAGDTFACDNVAPMVSASSNASSVPENETGTLTAIATDRNSSDELTYRWVQLSGPDAAIANPEQAETSFTASEVNSDTELVFEVTVSDGSLDSKATVSLQVTNIPPPAEPVVKKSSGSLGLFSLLLFSSMLIRRKRK